MLMDNCKICLNGGYLMGWEAKLCHLLQELSKSFISLENFKCLLSWDMAKTNQNGTTLSFKGKIVFENLLIFEKAASNRRLEQSFFSFTCFHLTFVKF